MKRMRAFGALIYQKEMGCFLVGADNGLIHTGPFCSAVRSNKQANYSFDSQTGFRGHHSTFSRTIKPPVDLMISTRRFAAMLAT